MVASTPSRENTGFTPRFDAKDSPATENSINRSEKRGRIGRIVLALIGLSAVVFGAEKARSGELQEVLNQLNSEKPRVSVDSDRDALSDPGDDEIIIPEQPKPTKPQI